MSHLSGTLSGALGLEPSMYSFAPSVLKAYESPKQPKHQHTEQVPSLQIAQPIP